MKAAVFKAPGKPLVIESLADPAPGVGELVLRVGRCGICGTDLHMTDGHAATYPINSVLGHEYAGEVVAVGRGVVNYKLGDVVAGLAVGGCGMCAQCLAGDPMWCEQGLDSGDGRFRTIHHRQGPFGDQASLHDLVRGRCIDRTAGSGPSRRDWPGSRPVHARWFWELGAIGLAAAFWARRVGREPCGGRIPVCSRGTHALAMGASHFEQFSEEFAAKIERRSAAAHLTSCSNASGPGMLTKAIEIVRARGTVVILGNCMKLDPWVPSLVVFKQLRLQGSMIYSRREFEIVAEVLDAGHVEARTMITDTIPLAELPGAFEALRSPTYQCKTLVDPWS